MNEFPLAPRERFRRTMHFLPCDRPPLLQAFIDDAAVARWRQEELPARESPADHFGMDRIEWAVEWRDWPRLDLGQWQRRPERWTTATGPERIAAWRDRDYPLGIHAWQGALRFLGVGDWATFAPVLERFCDDPGWIADHLAMLSDWNADLIDTITGEVDIDFATFSEPIAGNHGPVISPAMFERLVIPAYRMLCARLRARGVDTVILRSTGGNVRLLLDACVEAGITALWPSQTAQTNMDFVELRQAYGNRLALIGGIDSRLLEKDPEAMAAQLEQMVPPLLAGGGYIPMLDDTVRAYVPYRRFADFWALLKRRTGSTRPAT